MRKIRESLRNSIHQEAEIRKLGRPKCSLLLNTNILYPTQGISEFRGETLSAVRLEFTSHSNFLEKEPLACCAYPLNSEHISDDLIEGAPYILPLMDGHHRLKVGADELHILDFPVDIFSIVQAHNFYRRKDSIANVPISVTMEQLFRWAMESTTLERREQLVVVRFLGSELRVG